MGYYRLVVIWKPMNPSSQMAGCEQTDMEGTAEAGEQRWL